MPARLNRGRLRLVPPLDASAPALDERARAIADAIAEELADYRAVTLASPERIEASLFARIVCGGEHWVGHTETLDTRGVFVTTYLTRPIGSDVELLLELPTSRVIEVHGVVVGVRPERRSPSALPGMEIRMLAMSRDDADLLQAWLYSVSVDFWSCRPPCAVDA